MNKINLLVSSSAMTQPSTLTKLLGNQLKLNIRQLQIQDFVYGQNLSFIKDFQVVLLDGGADVFPLLYKELPTGKSGYNIYRDFEEMFIYNGCIKINPDIKFSGICRGHQFLAVMSGMKLIQDLYSSGFGHENRHNVIINPESVLYKYIGEKKYTTNSLHHQAVQLTEKLYPLVSSFEEKTGIIESIETDNIRSVQWHPEMMGDTKVLKYLMWSDYYEK